MGIDVMPELQHVELYRQFKYHAWLMAADSPVNQQTTSIRVGESKEVNRETAGVPRPKLLSLRAKRLG